MEEIGHERAGRVAFIFYRGGVVGEDGMLDESLVDEHTSGQPLAVPLGMSQIPKGIEEAIYDMQIGEERTVRIPSELGYGECNPDEVQWYPRSILPNGYQLEIGSVLVYTVPETQEQRPARVIDSTDDGVRIDMNHPFAGKELEYWLKLEKLV